MKSDRRVGTRQARLGGLIVAFVLVLLPRAAWSQENNPEPSPPEPSLAARLDTGLPIPRLSAPLLDVTRSIRRKDVPSALEVPDAKRSPALSDSQQLSFDEHPRFWDRTNKILLVAATGAAVADFCTTRHVVSRGGKEVNPLARPFAGSESAFAAYKAANVAGYFTLSYLFHRKGRHDLERLLPVVSVATDGGSAGLNLRFIF